MAVEVSRVKARLKAKFPKANLSKERIDAIAAKLAKKPEDDADDDAIDEILQDFNDNSAMTFEEIAKNDDRLRTLEASKKPEKTEKIETVDDDNDDTPAWAKKLVQRMDSFETSQKQGSLSTRFNNDDRLKSIPEFMKKGFIPSSEEEYEEKVTELASNYEKFAEQHKLDTLPKDKPVGSQDKLKSGEVKKISPETAKSYIS